MKKRFWILLIVFLASCQSSYEILSHDLNETQPEGISKTIHYPTGGVKGDILYEMTKKIHKGDFGEIHSILISRNYEILFEDYFNGYDYAWEKPEFKGEYIEWDENIRHNVHSVGKSITSACVGIAIREGFIHSVDDPIMDYLPEYMHLFEGEKKDITIEHLLTMTAGLEWDEWGSSYADGNNDVIRLWTECEDPIACVLEKPMVSTPGTTFTYSGGNTVLLGEIIKNASGINIESFSWSYLFGPMEIKNPPWVWINDTVVYAGGDQRLTPREMARFGALYLDEGTMNQKEIIPAEWVRKSAYPYSGPDNSWFNSFLKAIPPGDNAMGKRGYAYSWWTHEFRQQGEIVPVFFALGFGGQKIFVIPDYQAVVVITAGNYLGSDRTMQLFQDFVLPALHNPGD